MIIILSPSKTMDMSNPLSVKNINLKENTKILIEKIKTFSPEELSKLMKVKGKILESTLDIYRNYNNSMCKKAIESYNGFVFKEIKLEEYNSEEKKFLNKHFNIISALYGVISPEDYIKEYRLDMTVKVFEDKNLYKFWEEDVNNSLINLCQNDKPLINLASNEFSKLINRKTFPFKIIDIEFKETKGDNFKAVSTYAKKARGLMANYIIKNQINQVDKLRLFNEDGYSLNLELSSEYKFIFTR